METEKRSCKIILKVHFNKSFIVWIHCNFLQESPGASCTRTPFISRWNVVYVLYAFLRLYYFFLHNFYGEHLVIKKQHIKLYIDFSCFIHTQIKGCCDYCSLYSFCIATKILSFKSLFNFSEILALLYEIWDHQTEGGIFVIVAMITMINLFLRFCVSHCYSTSKVKNSNGH